MVRAGPVTVPARRMDSNIEERRRAQGEGLLAVVGAKVLRFSTVAPLREERMVLERDGVLRMSRTVDIMVYWMLRRPTQIIITIRSAVHRQ